jgi:monoamine oxidase
MLSGGSVQIANTVHRYLESRTSDVFTFNKRVTGIKAVKNNSGATIGIDVTTDHYETERFSHVISSIPLPVLRTIDLTEAGLTPMQSNALRQLNYGPSVKIGMQFRTAWWTTGKDKDGRRLNIVGGQTYTDTPLRTVVYPSFGNVRAGKTTTLIASYCWTEDAERLAALITNDHQVLEEMTLRELAKIHNVTVEFLRGQLIDTFAWSWSQDPFTMGALSFSLRSGSAS